MGRLPGEDVKALREAIQAAYRSHIELTIFLREELDILPNEIMSEGQSMRMIATSLIGWAESKGFLTELLVALREGSNNPEIQAVCQRLLQSSSPIPSDKLVTMPARSSTTSTHNKAPESSTPPNEVATTPAKSLSASEHSNLAKIDKPWRRRSTWAIITVALVTTVGLTSNRTKFFSSWVDRSASSSIDLLQALQEGSEYAFVHQHRGEIYLRQGEYDQAIAAFNRVIQLEDDNATAYNSRGQTYGYEGEYELAIEDFSRAIQLDSYNAIAHRNRGNAYLRKGEYDLAIDDYNRSLEIEFSDEETRSNRDLAIRLRKR